MDGSQAEIFWPELPNYGEPKRGCPPATANFELIEVSLRRGLRSCDRHSKFN